MELVWKCIMLITNLVHVGVLLEDSKFTHRRMSLRTSSCGYARVVNLAESFCEKFKCAYKYKKTYAIISE